MKSTRLSALVLGAVVCAWATSPALAVPVLGPGDSDGVIINGGDPTFAPEGSEDQPFLTGLGANTTGYVKIFDPDGVTVSDLAWTNSDRQIEITSDDESGNLFGAPDLSRMTLLGSITEDGTFQDISTFFGLQAGTLLVASDVSETPIPAALPLFAGGAGLIGFLAGRRKQKRAT